MGISSDAEATSTRVHVAKTDPWVSLRLRDFIEHRLHPVPRESGLSEAGWLA